MNATVRIAPSLLSADFARLGEEVSAVIAAGADLIEARLQEIEAVRKHIDTTGRDIWLEVDGGVKADNAKRIGSAGADTLVAGPAVFNGGTYQQAIPAFSTQASAERHARVTLQ